MSGRKLGRLAGLVFVLVAFVGGTGSAAFGAERAPEGEAIVVTSSVIDWS